MYFIEFDYEFVSFTFPFHLNRNLMGSRYKHVCKCVCVSRVETQGTKYPNTVDRINSIYAFLYIFSRCCHFNCLSILSSGANFICVDINFILDQSCVTCTTRHIAPDPKFIHIFSAYEMKTISQFTDEFYLFLNRRK